MAADRGDEKGDERGFNRGQRQLTKQEELVSSPRDA